MNVAINTPVVSNNSSLQDYKKNNKKVVPAFGGKLSAGYDTFCNKLGEKVLVHVYNNKLMGKLGYWFRNSENAVKHFLTVGSIITSSMYMYRTLVNEKIKEKDRRYVLTANQGATLVISTALAYLLDDKVKNKWAGLHERYLSLSAPGRAVLEGIQKENKLIEASNAKLPEELRAGKYSVKNLSAFIREHGEKYVLDEKALSKLNSRSKGFMALRSILVFGFIYRFFVPLAVVKPTNIICDKILKNMHEKKAAKQMEATKAQEVKPDAKAVA